MVGHGGSSAGSYLADPTSPIPSHCASIFATSTLRVNVHAGYIHVMFKEAKVVCFMFSEMNGSLMVCVWVVSSSVDNTKKYTLKVKQDSHPEDVIAEAIRRCVKTSFCLYNFFSLFYVVLYNGQFIFVFFCTHCAKLEYI